MERRWSDDEDRLRELSVMRALELQFVSGADILSFYEARTDALVAGRGPARAVGCAQAALERMDALVAKEEAVTQRILPLAERDSRLGFHSEAEAHQYYPAKLRWRLEELAKTRRRIVEIGRQITAGGEYPMSVFEQTAQMCRVGEWMTGRNGVRFRVLECLPDGVKVEVEAQPDKDTGIWTMNRYCTKAYGFGLIRRGTGRAICDIPGEASWIFLGDNLGAVWPPHDEPRPYRLRFGAFYPTDFGRIVPTEAGKDTWCVQPNCSSAKQISIEGLTASEESFIY